MELSKLLKIRNIGLILILVGLVLSFFTQSILGKESVLVAVPFILSVAGIITIIIIAISPCPFCKKQFFWSWRFSNPFTIKCMHCGKGVNDKNL